MATLLEAVNLRAVQLHRSELPACLRLQCPACGRSLEETSATENSASLTCVGCGFSLTNRSGIWEALSPARHSEFQRFIEEYQTVRQIEGRGSGGGHYYLELPFKDTTGRNSWQWNIRSRSFRFLTGKLLPILEYRNPDGLDILDLGAGNCWLSYRLATRGHRPVAVDLLVNQMDGLGAARHYLPFLRLKFPRFQAEMDRLPFAPGQFDLAIFNASFHYSEDYNRTLEECLRCLRRPGHIFIMDSPLYEHEESGEQMVRERRASFERVYGFRSDSIASREYLTPSMVEDLGRRYGMSWTILHPWYGLKWALRPLRARLLRRRAPARFQIIWGTVE